MKCKFCGAEVKVNEKCQYCGSVAEPEYYGLKREYEADRTYIVKAGDTLWAIAKTLYGSGTEYMRIVRKNKIKNQNLIYPGQVLKV